jgi:protein tyrosine phosphatase (PTP) superfamily phosphohydrolase (DUF442 family)
MENAPKRRDRWIVAALLVCAAAMVLFAQYGSALWPARDLRPPLATSAWREANHYGPGFIKGRGEAGELKERGLNNVFRVTDRIYCGSSPDGDEGFRSLEKLGIKTILSVDGARPDVKAARSHGMRYVHIPFGYDGISKEQALRLAKAVRDLPGPVYIHCHHGQHRGPAAAAVVHLALDPSCTVDTALAEMRRAGTDPRYVGLYAAPRTLHRPTSKELDQLSADFPEAVAVAALAQAMVQIDDRFDHLKLARSAGWKVPKDQPDIDPPHEALQIAEHFREARRLADANKRPADLRAWLADAEQKISNLETLLRSRGTINQPAAERAFAAVSKACTHCHARYRDPPTR